MHTIEPFFQWRNIYTAEADARSPFYEREYDEFEFKNAVYNYVIHPQWDDFGSSTLYLKILYTNYERQFTIIELIGEWNDLLHNDIMYLKRNIGDHLIDEGINKFIIICDNVLNYHPSDNLYLEEWYQDIVEEGGWISCINLLEHVFEDFEENRIQDFVFFNEQINELDWRMIKPEKVYDYVDQQILTSTKKINF